MAHIRSMLLCDHAQVREGLLFVTSGGITRLAVPGPDSPVQFHLAGQLEIPAGEQGRTHTIDMKVTSAGSATDVWRATMTITTPESSDQLFPGESTIVPFAVLVGPFLTPDAGPHDLKVSVDDTETVLSTFYVLHAAAAGSPPIPSD